jgi:hypothetical protein
MVEIRVAVDDPTRAYGLMRRLVALFGRSSISFDRSRNEVHVKSEWESRGVVQLIEAVQAWIEEDRGKRVRLYIGSHSYELAGVDR